MTLVAGVRCLYFTCLPRLDRLITNGSCSMATVCILRVRARCTISPPRPPSLVNPPADSDSHNGKHANDNNGRVHAGGRYKGCISTLRNGCVHYSMEKQPIFTYIPWGSQ